jgi:phage/plasmid-associated DNA primase
MTNYKPHADARDQAFWSRACLLEFGMRFVERPKAPNERQADPGLKEKLRQERSGILAWLVRGCLAWQELGLAIPASISLATEKYRDEEDRILHFLNERCMLRPEVSVKASVLYEAYKAWCEENQFGRGMNATLFGNEIGKRFEKKRGNTGMIYQGVRVLTTQQQSVGGVYTPSYSANDDDRPLEATSQATEKEGSVGCVGFRQVFPQNAFESQYKGQNREKPYTPYTSSTIVDSGETSSEASGEQKKREEKPYTNPTRSITLPEGWEEFVL